MGLFDLFKKAKPQLTEEQQKWNRMWELWVEEKVDSPYKELMTYQSEVNNGVHAQYFNNTEWESNMDALAQILPQKLKSNLQEAYKAHLMSDGAGEKADEIFDQCDAVFYENEEEILQMLKAYACANEPECPFLESENTAVITCCHILENGADILYVSHDAQDGMWQFLCGRKHTQEEARIISLQEAVTIDDTICEVAKMSCGSVAKRKRKAAKWVVKKK